MNEPIKFICGDCHKAAEEFDHIRWLEKGKSFEGYYICKNHVQANIQHEV